jgi:hypothetical protein
MYGLVNAGWLWTGSPGVRGCDQGLFLAGLSISWRVQPGEQRPVEKGEISLCCSGLIVMVSWKSGDLPPGRRPGVVSLGFTMTGLACAGAVSDDIMQNATPITIRTILIMIISDLFF